MSSSTDDFYILGHRGSPLRHHENTIASLEQALEEGAVGFETDVRTLADGSIVLFHDDEVGGRAVESLTFDELSTVSPSLTHLSEIAPLIGRATITLEVKRTGNERGIAEVINGWSGVTVSSFDHRVLRRMRGSGYAGPLGAVYYGYIDDAATYAARLGASVLYPAFRYVDRDLVTRCSEAGVAVVPWTPNDPQQWEYLLSVGCQGVITDTPGEAALWRRSLL